MTLSDYEREHNALLRSRGGECTVLLKADGAFPLAAPGRIALFGSGARRTVKGGTGSGEVNSRYFVTVEQGLEDAGFTVTSKFWLESYERVYTAARKGYIEYLKADARKKHTNVMIEHMGFVMPDPEYCIPLKGEGEAAVYVLSRISGEGSDRRAVPGDILLTETETRDILELNRRFEKFLLVLNVGGVVDLSPVKEVGNILLLSQLGVETGSILADLLLGTSYPSGKLSASWAAWEDYPKIGSFGDRDETEYREGVYVGYRYFDLSEHKPLFPFGFGLGYTSFELKSGGVQVKGQEAEVKLTVKNTGDRPGKEVAQLYVTAPEGRLDKPLKSLVAFRKTKELKPGESEELTLRFALQDMASYDRTKAAWVLEKGDYVLRLGASSAETKAVAVLRLDGEVLTRKVKKCFGKPGFTDWAPEAVKRAAPRFTKVIKLPADELATETVVYAKADVIDPLIASLSDEELARMNIGDFPEKGGSLSVIGNASRAVAGAAGETCGCLREKGIPSLVMADGPAGLRLSREYTVDEKGVHDLGAAFPESMLELLGPLAQTVLNLVAPRKAPTGEIHEQYCTAIPIGTALAQSWSAELCELCGDIVGDEMERFGVHLWLAPALNIHRDVRCGRNFEYFSEDPLLSGKMAAAITRGVQKHPGCGTTIKHYAANNQETNRYRSNSRVSERAMREIYLKGFEIAVKESQPHALMTSYNLLNGTHTSERRDLIEDVLRSEFGYKGIVMTDWVISLMGGKGKHRFPKADLIAASGNDLTMPGGSGDLKQMLKGLGDGSVSREQLRINATRVYRMAKKLTKKES